MTGHVRIVLYGGPEDGHEERLSDLPDRYLILAPAPAVFLAPGEDPVTVRAPVDTYELEYTNGRPSLDNRGRHRYQYRGRR